MDEKFLERSTDSKQIVEGKLLKVYRAEVTLPSGGQAVREYIKHPGTVIIVAMRNNGKVVRQYRYVQHSVSLELPAGRIDPGEKPLNAAKRELREETGHVAAKWTPLLLIHSCRYCQVNNGSEKTSHRCLTFVLISLANLPQTKEFHRILWL